MSAINLYVLFKVMPEKTNWLEFNVIWDEVDVCYDNVVQTYPFLCVSSMKINSRKEFFEFFTLN